VHKKTLLLLLAFAIVFDFTGCAMSPQARRERAFRHYMAKQIKQRQRAMARAQKAANRQLKEKMKNVQPSEPMVRTSVGEVSSESSSPPVTAPEPAPAFRETTVDPITVSASDAIATQNPDQPSQP
jgi:hypothetical protein